jgi:acetoin utilization protein AcuB
MSKSIPKISKYMTTTPHAINSEAALDEAMEVMHKNKIRHLPVIKAGKLFGLVSDRDVQSVMSFAGSNPKEIKVGDICTDQLYMTKPDAMLNEVASEMASKKFGSAIVVDNGKLVGIFTATDACQALSEICEARFHA